LAPALVQSWAERWAGWWVSERWQFQGLGSLSQRVLSWRPWQARLAARRPEDSREHSSAWVFRSMRRNATRARSKTETSCSLFIPKIAQSAIAQRKSSRLVARRIFPTLVRPLFLKIKEQPRSVIKVVRVEVGDLLDPPPTLPN